MIAILVLGGALLAWVLWPEEDPARRPIDLETFSEDSTATVVFAGQFPPLDAEPLERPLGIDGDGESLYVAIADAGLVGIWDYQGALVETFAVEPAPGAAAFYPVDLAVLRDGRLAIADTAGERVVIVDASSERAPDVLDTEIVGVPTAIDVAEDTIAVADSSAGVVRLLTVAGQQIGTLGQDADPPLTFVGGIALSDDGRSVVLADSNAGRVVRFDVETGSSEVALERRFALPRGLTSVFSGRLAVVDTFDRLVHLAPRGGEDSPDEEAVGDSRTERVEAGGSLAAPDSVFWDAESSRLFVTDSAEGRVKVYELREVAP